MIEWLHDTHNIWIYVDEDNRPHIKSTILNKTGVIEYPTLVEISRLHGVEKHRVYTWPSKREAYLAAIDEALTLIP